MNTISGALPEWQYFLGLPVSTGIIRARMEDFMVWELPLVEPSGQGNHLWLEVEKRGANTNWVAAQLSLCAGVQRRDVGFAGMKDRHGLTRQWFSVSLQEASNPDPDNWAIEDVTFIEVQRHERKLKRGALRGNRFRLVVREVSGEAAEMERRLNRIRDLGVPNYFGPQRFGHGGLNIQRAASWLEKGGRLPRDKKSIYLSSARSYLFNQVLSERVSQGNWNRIVDGDIALLDGSRSVFDCTMPDQELEQRCDAFDIHPTGPLPGRGGRAPARDAAQIEQAAMQADAGLLDGLARAGAEAARRSLRVRPQNFSWQWDEQALELSFDLPAGAYATSVLRELMIAADAATRSGKIST